MLRLIAKFLCNLIFSINKEIFLLLEVNFYLDFMEKGDKDLWQLSKTINVLLINGDRFLDFPRPLPLGISFIGEVGKIKVKKNKENSTIKLISLPKDIEKIYNDKNSLGVIIFSLGTVSNSTNMPEQMIHAFLQGFLQFPEFHFIWKTELTINNINQYLNIHIFRWIPQKALMRMF